MIKAIAKPITLRACLRAVVLLLGVVATAHGADSHDIDVDVDVNDGIVRVVTSYFVEATPREVWAVMADFESAPRFSANLKTSVVLARNEDVVRISQAGAATFGPIRFPFDSIRELRLIPERRIESRMISGSMKRYQGVTELTPEGAGTRIRHRSEAVPNRWIPPVVGPHLIARETREHILEFRAEILRRKSAVGK